MLGSPVTKVKKRTAKVETDSDESGSDDDDDDDSDDALPLNQLKKKSITDIVKRTESADKSFIVEKEPTVTKPSKPASPATQLKSSDSTKDKSVVAKLQTKAAATPLAKPPSTVPEKQSEEKQEATAQSKPEVPAQAKSEATSQAKPETISQAKSEATPQAKPEPTPQVKPVTKTQSKPAATPQEKSSTTVQIKPSSAAQTKSSTTPQTKPSTMPHTKSSGTSQIKSAATPQTKTSSQVKLITDKSSGSEWMKNASSILSSSKTISPKAYSDKGSQPKVIPPKITYHSCNSSTVCRS